MFHDLLLSIDMVTLNGGGSAPSSHVTPSPSGGTSVPSYVFISFGIVSTFINCTTPSSGMAALSLRSEVNEPTVNLYLSHLTLQRAIAYILLYTPG
jgi:hypothetical protein